MLNVIWISFFVVAFGMALFRGLFLGDVEVFSRIMSAVFEMARVSFQVALGLVGVMAFWMGILRIGEKAGALRVLTRVLQPLFKRIFPDVPECHPALGAMTMNLASNMLGLDNAATPFGLKAMKELQGLNPDKTSASNSQILFLVLNTSSVTIFPVTIFTYRAQQGAADPADVFIPILIATFCSTLVGLVSVALVQRIQLIDRVLMAWLVGLLSLVLGTAMYFSSLPPELMQARSAAVSNFLLLALILAFLTGAAVRKIDAFAAFVEGARQGFGVAVKIVPYLVGILVAVGVFRASGALDLLLDGVRVLVAGAGWDTRWVGALPTALMKPLSGSGARGLMVETMQHFGADSLAGRLACIVQGSTETTFYVLALYFGAVGIRRSRHALACGLLADAAGILAAFAVGSLFFGGH